MINGKIWDSAYTLSRYLISHPHLVASKRVLDLSAGVGILSLVAASSGAFKVVATELRKAMRLLYDNIHHSGYENAETHVLEWGDVIAVDKIGRFDVILGSDIVYEVEHFDALVYTLRMLVSADGIVMLMYKVRGMNDEEVMKFVDRMKVFFEVCEGLVDEFISGVGCNLLICKLQQQ
ncbi:hypothetical protein SeMB42_g02053 [Synchytrium endobioticum]|uniref:Uncharacterized protein n=1 Tax=Synchytrium endobioticum TaxID=286115 RepID=A0A507DA14_9FUNG|nr:hypothetical protein SeLEV6574_g01991 [Synchytrium endobioticum]TPX50961.1 hypothetical protein SeMB42_g02053 [Synchytrium endobioticum]